jgi:hypothetical protein
MANAPTMYLFARRLELVMPGSGPDPIAASPFPVGWQSGEFGYSWTWDIIVLFLSGPKHCASLRISTSMREELLGTRVVSARREAIGHAAHAARAENGNPGQGHRLRNPCQRTRQNRQAARGKSGVELAGCDTGRALAGTQPTYARYRPITTSTTAPVRHQLVACTAEFAIEKYV